jgi:hypothetical protein
MAHVVQIELSGSQALLIHDDAGEDLKIRWDIFIKKFKGYNLCVAKEFSQTFDGYRETFGDVQLEVTEDLLSEETRLPLTGYKWLKNSKINEVPWNLFMTYKNIDCCENVIHVSFLKVRWHGLLSVIKQFITCEGCYGLDFLYHVRFLMLFTGFRLNVSFYLLRCLYKMSKRYKKKSLDSSLFHHGLIKMLLIHHLKTLGDDWDGFLARNSFVTDIPTETHMLDKPMIEKHFDFSNDKPNPLKKNPHHEEIPDQFLLGQQNVGSESIGTLGHELVVGLKASIISDSEDPRKQSKKKQAMLGF